MNILVLTQILPYPPDAGPRVKTWHVLRYLAESGHHVHLATFLRPEEAPYLGRVRSICTSVHTVPIRRSRLRDAYFFGRSLVSGRPFLIERDDLPEMRRLVQKIVAEHAIEVVHADQVGMAQFALGTGAATLFDSHNAVWMVVERMAKNAPALLRPLLRLEAARMKSYAVGLLSRFDQVMTVTENDRNAFIAALGESGQHTNLSGGAPAERITAVPIAVDSASLPQKRHVQGSANILTLGTLHYPPNADGIRWFFQQVYPLIREERPEVSLTIVGKNPPSDFQSFARGRDDVQVTGYVPALEPYMDAAAMMAVPVRAGGGMRVRILEAFARGIPVVTTTVGLEGIRAEHGTHVLVADSPHAFAGCVLQLLDDPQMGRRLAEQGRRLVEEHYDWRVVLRGMDMVYGRLARDA